MIDLGFNTLSLETFENIFNMFILNKNKKFIVL